MALKHVKKYYLEIEKMYFELADSLKEMEEDFKKGEITEDQLNNLLLPVSGLKENYLRLSYVMHLFAQPNRPEKAKKFEKRNKDMVEFFKEHKLSMKEDLEESRDVLNTFKKSLEDFRGKK